MRNVTVVAQSKVRAIAAKLNLNIKEKGGEFKVFGSSISQSIAIPNTKGGATRIYLVGFTAKEGTVAHPKPPAKTVTQMFDHTLPEKQLLAAIFKACKVLASSMPKAPAAAPTREEVMNDSPAASPATASPVEA
jgi:hypothetical protein